VVLTMIRVIAYTLSWVFYHRQVVSIRTIGYRSAKSPKKSPGSLTAVSARG
jgi:hypothetical protein